MILFLIVFASEIFCWSFVNIVWYLLIAGGLNANIRPTQNPNSKKKKQEKKDQATNATISDNTIWPFRPNSSRIVQFYLTVSWFQSYFNLFRFIYFRPYSAPINQTFTQMPIFSRVSLVRFFFSFYTLIVWNIPKYTKPNIIYSIDKTDWIIFWADA